MAALTNGPNADQIRLPHGIALSVAGPPFHSTAAFPISPFSGHCALPERRFLRIPRERERDNSGLFLLIIDENREKVAKKYSAKAFYVRNPLR